MSPPPLTEEQKSDLRRVMGASPLTDQGGRSVAVIRLAPGEVERFPVHQSISVAALDPAAVIDRLHRALGGAGLVVTITRRPGEPDPTDWRRRPSPLGLVVGESTLNRADRQFRLTLVTALALIAAGILVGTIGAVGFHSGLWAFVGYTGFILPGVLILMVFGTVFDSEMVICVLGRPLVSGTLSVSSASAGPPALTIYAGSVRSREHASRRGTWRRIERVGQGPTTQSVLDRVVQGFG